MRETVAYFYDKNGNIWILGSNGAVSKNGIVLRETPKFSNIKEFKKWAENYGNK